MGTFLPKTNFTEKNRENLLKKKLNTFKAYTLDYSFNF